MSFSCTHSALVVLLAISTALTATRANADNLVGTLPVDVLVDNKGAANTYIPLQIPAGRSGIQPKLSLNYNSQSGNGPLGMGWSISTGFPQSITRGRSILARDGTPLVDHRTGTSKYSLPRRKPRRSNKKN